MKETRINYDIKSQKVFLIGVDGSMIGEIHLNDAVYKAKSVGLDLVEVGNKNNIPVCKIMDFGKYKYEQEKSKKKNTSAKTQTKEIRFHPNTGDNDLKYRAKQAEEFLKDGHKVKVTVRFRGREQHHLILGGEIIDKFLEMICIKFDKTNPSLDGNNLSITLTQ